MPRNLLAAAFTQIPATKTRKHEKEQSSLLRAFVSSWLRLSLSVVRSNRDKSAAAFPVDEQQHRTVRALPQRRAQILDALHRLTIYFFDDVARLDAGVGRASIRINVLHENAASVARQNARSSSASIR